MYSASVCSEYYVTSRCSQNAAFLGELAELRKTTISSVMCVRPSVHMEQLGSH